MVRCTGIRATTASDVLIVGAGLAGLVTAWQTAIHGLRTRVITKGWGATHWHSGCIDVLGYYPPASEEAVESPAEAVARLIRENPHHPYAITGLGHLDEAIRAWQALCAQAGYHMLGSLERNWLLPSAVGAVRPTCLAPETMVSGDLRQHGPMLIVGFEPFLDFYPHLIADNINQQGSLAHAVTLDLPSLRQRRFVTTMILANLFDTPEFRAEAAEALRPQLGRASRVGFPAVLGLHHPIEAKRDLEAQLGRQVFEIPTLPPSVPGIRLHNLLVTAIRRAGGQVFNGMEALSAEAEGRRVTTVWTEAAARQRSHHATTFVLATGGILGGGIITDHNERIREVVFNLPIAALADRSEWFQREFLASLGHLIYQAGVEVNDVFQPVDKRGQVVYENLFAAGAILAHTDTIRERSFEGVALATGYAVGLRIVQEHKTISLADNIL
jgi:glycerol-3-phosphate dehydrogenase subunit B